MQQICKAAKLSPGQLYRFFESKEAIIIAMAEHERENTLELIDHINKHQDNLPMVLDSMLEGLIKDITRPDYSELMLELSSEASHSQEIKEIFARIDGEVLSCLEAAIVASKKAGNVRKQINPKTTALTLLCVFEGISSRSALQTIKHGRAFTKTIKQMIYRLLCDGDT